MDRKDQIKYILADIEREIALRKLKEKSGIEEQNEKIIFKEKRIYQDHEVTIDWKREVAEA